MTLILACSISVLFGGCSFRASDRASFENAYDIYETSYEYGILHQSTEDSANLFASNLCVVANENTGEEDVDAQVIKAGGLFNETTGEVPFRKNIFNKVYPASTTKVMTAYLAIKYGNLDDAVTVTENAIQEDPESTVAYLRPGDVLTLRDLLYGLMLVSGNDAAVAIAEHISGSVEEFVGLMNAEATKLGATNTHYVTANGMPANEHYTTTYDMYLIFRTAIHQDTFREVIGAVSYTANYSDANGSPMSQTWANRNRYISGAYHTPEGITVIGGKTGTTDEAGYCLVVYAKNERNEDLISIIFGADSSENLYYVMNEVLYNFGAIHS